YELKTAVISPASNKTKIAVQLLGNNQTTAAATNKMILRNQSGHKLRAIFTTACATTATVINFSAAKVHGVKRSATWLKPTAHKVNNNAVGKVKPSHAAQAPRKPAH